MHRRFHRFSQMRDLLVLSGRSAAGISTTRCETTPASQQRPQRFRAPGTTEEIKGRAAAPAPGSSSTQAATPPPPAPAAGAARMQPGASPPAGPLGGAGSQQQQQQKQLQQQVLVRVPVSIERADTYERTYSTAADASASLATDAAIAAALAENEAEAAAQRRHTQQRPRPDTSMDEALALQLHEREATKLERVHSAKAMRSDRRLRSLLGGLNITKVIPRLNPLLAPSESYVSADRQRLLLRLDMYALHERTVVGDGNCQFRSLADQLYADQEAHVDVRRAVVGQLQRCPERYRDYVSGGTYDEYVSSISRLGSWGDHVTLQAAADAYVVRICLVTSFLTDCVISITPQQEEQQQQAQQQQEQQQQQHSVDEGRTLWLSFWAEVHYNSLAPKGPSAPSDSSSDDDSGGGPRGLAGRIKQAALKAGGVLLH